MNLREFAATTMLFLMPVLTANAGVSPGVESNTREFLEALNSSGGTPLEQLAVADARNVLVGAQRGAELPDARVEERTITVEGAKIDLVIVKPPGRRRSDLPVFMYFHGGGWVLGDFPTHERLIRDLVVRSGAAAVYVDYTPSPEAQYPTAINQAFAATQWVAKNGREIGVDGTRLAVAGNSVGGNMAAVVSLKAKQAGGPSIRFQLLLWPVTDANFENASYQAYGADHFLTTPMMRWFWDNYTMDPQERDEIFASPLRATIEQLAGLPPALIQTAEMDVLRDEAEAYARKLNEAGVRVTSVRYNGMIHDFGLLNPLADVPAVQDSLDHAGAALKNKLFED
ncbi:MAG: alpha/beta hydrolase [Pseudomonadota bacterium]